MKTMIAIFIFGLLGGCMSQGGQADYSMRTEFHPDGSIKAFNLEIHNDKNIGEVTAMVTMPDGTEILLSEKGVDASGPMAIAGENQSKLIDALMGIVP